MEKQKGVAPILIIVGITVALFVGGAILAYRMTRPKQPVVINNPNSFPSTEASASAKPLGLGDIPNPTASSSARPSGSPSPTTKTNSSYLKLNCSLYLSNNITSGFPPFYATFGGEWRQDRTKFGRVSLDFFRYDLDGDGNWDTDWIKIPPAGFSIPGYTYQKGGTYNPKLQVLAEDGEMSDPCTTQVTVNSPTVSCEVHSDITSGKAPLNINFYYGASFYGVRDQQDDYVTNVQWDFNGDGNWDTPMDVASQRVAHSYTQTGNYTVKMHLESKNGLKSEICTGNISVN